MREFGMKLAVKKNYRMWLTVMEAGSDISAAD
jgi:hypothetical protein